MTRDEALERLKKSLNLLGGEPERTTYGWSVTCDIFTAEVEHDRNSCKWIGSLFLVGREDGGFMFPERHCFVSFIHSDDPQLVADALTDWAAVFIDKLRTVINKT